MADSRRLVAVGNVAIRGRLPKTGRADCVTKVLPPYYCVPAAWLDGLARGRLIIECFRTHCLHRRTHFPNGTRASLSIHYDQHRYRSMDTSMRLPLSIYYVLLFLADT